MTRHVTASVCCLRLEWLTPTSASGRRKNFRQRGGKEGDKWPHEKEAIQRVFPEGGCGIVSDVPASMPKKLKASMLWVSVISRKLLLKNRPNDARVRASTGSRRWANKGAGKHDLYHRRKSNSKNKSGETSTEDPEVPQQVPSVAQRPKAFGRAGGSSRAAAGGPGGGGHPSASPSAGATQRPARDPKYGCF